MAKKEMHVFDFDAFSFFVVQIICATVLKDAYHTQVLLYTVFGIVVTVRYMIYVVAIIRQLLDVFNISF